MLLILQEFDKKCSWQLIYAAYKYVNRNVRNFYKKVLYQKQLKVKFAPAVWLENNDQKTQER